MQSDAFAGKRGFQYSVSNFIFGGVGLLELRTNTQGKKQCGFGATEYTITYLAAIPVYKQFYSPPGHPL
jgi:hypothetical protein